MNLAKEILEQIDWFQYRDELNPKIWDGDHLKSTVRIKLLEIVDKFVEFVKLPASVQIVQKIFTGSMCTYAYTQFSDLDTHVIIDIPRSNLLGGQPLKVALNARKALWSLQYHPEIFKYPVELYLQDVNEQFIGSGIYDLVEDKWLRHPEHITNLHIDRYAIELKSKDLQEQIDAALKDGNEIQINDLKKKIRDFRKSGLETGGEYSTENLAFKDLRNNGYLQKLAEYEKALINRSLSYDEE